MIINAENLIVGRLASFVAKKALLGEAVSIVNCDKAVMTGRKEDILLKYKIRTDKGGPFHGPFMQRREERFVKRIIRGMLPWRQDRGRKAYKLIMCYRGIPEQFHDKKLETLEQAHVKKMKSLNYMRMSELTKHIGRK